MAEIRINATGGVKLYDADDSHYAQIIAGTITSNTDVMTLGHNVIDIPMTTASSSATTGALTIGGGLGVAADLYVGDDTYLITDSAVLGFGADKDTTLTHTDGTGLTLNSTNKLCFNDASQFIQGSSNAILSLGATDEIDLTATAVDLNGTLDVSGATTTAAITASGIIKTDDTTAATSTTDGSLQTDGGLSVALDAVIGDDLYMLSDASVIHFGADSEITLTHVHNAGLILGGTTPTLTIGDAGAEDAKIVFDGNAQDFHIGLDDSADDLVIGLGSTLGTTSHIVIDEAGHVTMPLQSCFSGNIGTEQANFAINSWTTMTFDTEIFDLNADYNTGTYTFTAPVAGKYIFSCNLQFNNLDYDSTYWQSQLKTSNREYPMLDSGNQYGANPTNLGVCLSVIADLDAADTAYMRFYQGGGAAEADLRVESYFTGCLLA